MLAMWPPPSPALVCLPACPRELVATAAPLKRAWLCHPKIHSDYQICINMHAVAHIDMQYSTLQYRHWHVPCLLCVTCDAAQMQLLILHACFAMLWAHTPTAQEAYI